MIDQQITNRPRCQTEGCDKLALGHLNGKWRCGDCIIRFSKKMEGLKEQYFIEENADNS